MEASYWPKFSFLFQESIKGHLKYRNGAATRHLSKPILSPISAAEFHGAVGSSSSSEAVRSCSGVRGSNLKPKPVRLGSYRVKNLLSPTVIHLNSADTILHLCTSRSNVTVTSTPNSTKLSFSLRFSDLHVADLCV